jgi:DNA primase
MDNSWVDFKAVKATVSIHMVLDHYGINWLRKETGDLVGKCPIHQGDGKRAFRVNVKKNIFNCFSCNARGNVIDFVAAMEQCSIREAAVKLKDWFSLSMPTTEGHHPTLGPPKIVEPTRAGESERKNKPLAFELKGIDTTHPYLAARGISQEAAKRFGIGFFPGKGSMSGRIVIPIHNEKGQLVAYAGRSIQDDVEPKYKFPLGFHKAQVLFNLHRVLMSQQSKVRLVVVVEGFIDCLKVHEAGFPAVALMGSSLSEAQEQLLAAHFTQVVLMLDGDEAGSRAAAEIAARLVRTVFVRIVDVGEGKQPDQLSSEVIQKLLTFMPAPSAASVMER